MLRSEVEVTASDFWGLGVPVATKTPVGACVTLVTDEASGELAAEDVDGPLGDFQSEDAP